MAAAVILEFEGVSVQDYYAVNAALVEGDVTAPPASVTWIELEAHQYRG